jgi:hypothetical protein
MIMQLGKIPEKEFLQFLFAGLHGKCKNPGSISEAIISITSCHPYYTQKLGNVVWEKAH